MCVDFSSVEFPKVWTYAKPFHAQGGVSGYVRQWEVFGVSADMRRFLLYEVCVDVRKIAPRTWRSFCVCTQIKIFWSFCGYAQTTSPWSFCDRTQKSSAPLFCICVSTQINNFWGFCGYAQLLEPEMVTLAPMICRSSNIGVSASVRKKAPRLY